MPLIKTGVSVKADMKFGWKPKEEISGCPIPLYYDFEHFQIPLNPLTKKHYIPLYLGIRIPNSLQVHRIYSNRYYSTFT